MDKTIHNRLARLEGQLKKVHEDISTDKDCEDVIPQFLAIKGALASVYEEYVKSSLDSCAKGNKQKMRKLIALLIKS